MRANGKRTENKSGGIHYPTEIQDYLVVRQERRVLYPRAALVGLIAGVVILAFRAALTVVTELRGLVMSRSHEFPGFGWIFPVLFVMLGAVVSVAMTRRFAPEAAGSGIPHLKAVLHRFREIHWKSLLPVKFIGGLFALGGGLALGREGPSVQIGGVVGDTVARWLNANEQERHTLISSGAGAGLAAAFNTPLAGFLFVLEELRRDFQPIVFGAALLSATIASIVARIGSGQFPLFTVPSYPVPDLKCLPLFALFGIVAGVFGIVFNRSLIFGIKLYSRIPPRYALLAAALTGGAVGLVGWFYPNLIGGGHELTESALKGEILLALIPIFFLMRLFLTTASYGAGAPGGIFMPLLALGALLGLGFGQVAQRIAPDFVTEPAVFAVVGMAVYFTAVVRAPLTGVVLIVEMTGNYSLMLSLLLSCFCAYAITELLKDKPIYEVLFERDLKKNNGEFNLERPKVMEFVVGVDAPFIGRTVKDLGLPKSCVLARCIVGDNEVVPRGDTVIEPHMRITAIISPESSEAIEIMRRGSGTHENE